MDSVNSIATVDVQRRVRGAGAVGSPAKEALTLFRSRDDGHTGGLMDTRLTFA